MKLRKTKRSSKKLENKANLCLTTDYKEDELNKAKNNFSFQELYSRCKYLNRESDRSEKIVITSKNHAIFLPNEYETLIEEVYQSRRMILTINSTFFS